MHSPDLSQENIVKIRDAFPNCVTEVFDEIRGELRLAVDSDQLLQELSNHTIEGPQERYRLDWPGKRKALLLANTPTNKALRPVTGDSLHFDTTKNLFIEGDNLVVLKLIQETYLGQIKLIYIDPPYNTGKDFIYRDRFKSNQIAHEIASGERTEKGERLVSNPERNGRFHSNWLTMITPRLRLAKNLLTRDGAIFVSCDEGEQPRLRLVMDEIFGQSNFIADLVWAAGRKNDSKFISISHEYILCYARDSAYLREKKVIWHQRKKGLDDIYSQYDRSKRQHDNDYNAISQDLKKWYSDLTDSHPAKKHSHYSSADHRGIYFCGDISAPNRSGPKYEVLHPITHKPVKIPASGWRLSPSEMDDRIADNRIHFGEDETTIPCIKRYLKDNESQVPYSVFYQDGRAASKRLVRLMGGKMFDYPKDELVLQEIIEMVTEDTDIILDFFAGSSTTAHSVMLQNATDGGNRKFIMVQLDEPINEKPDASNAGFKTIAEISRERIRRAGEKILEENCHPDWNQDIGFRTLKVDSSNMKDVYYRPDEIKQSQLWEMLDNVKDNRTHEDLLFHVLVDLGIDLTLPIRQEIIQKKIVFFVNQKELVACFDMGLTEELLRELANLAPFRIVFRDNGFVTDAVKINAQQIFRQISPSTNLKSI